MKANLGTSYVDEPAFRVPLRASWDTTRLQLLRPWLQQANSHFKEAAVIRAAHDAESIAWQTYHPELWFPLLLEEKAIEALKYASRQIHLWGGRSLHEQDAVAA